MSMSTAFPASFPASAPLQTSSVPSDVGGARLYFEVHRLAGRAAVLDAVAEQAEVNRYRTALYAAMQSREPGAVSQVPPLDTTPTPPTEQLLAHVTKVQGLLETLAAGDPALASLVAPYLEAFRQQLAPDQVQALGSAAADALWALAHAATQFLLVQVRTA